MPVELPLAQPTGSGASALAAARTKNAAVVASSRVKSWLPTYTLKRRGRTVATDGRSSSAATSTARRRSPASGC